MAIAIKNHFELQPYNTFNVPAFAKYFARITDVHEVKELLLTDVYKEGPVFVLGGGSNVLFTHDFDGLILQITIPGVTENERNDKNILVTVGAGERWHNFVMWCIGKNYGGVENLALIPGTVGAAPIQNIGAYGVEVKEVIDSVTAVDVRSGKEIIFTAGDCKFGYRDSYFKHEGKDRYIITAVTFRLTTEKHQLNTSYSALQDALKGYPSKELSIKMICEAVIAVRKRKLPDPEELGNAGSFFKNPIITKSNLELLLQKDKGVPSYKVNEREVKIPAAWLIEQCGWKGNREGSVGVYDLQPLVLVNYGGGSGEAVLNLSQRIQASVHEKFGIELIPEVTLL